MVLEVRAHLENDADLRRAMDANATMGTAGAIEFPRGEDCRIATRSSTMRIQGLDAALRCEVLAIDGLAYVLIAWGPNENRERLDARVAEFCDAIVFPGKDSARAATMAPQRLAFPIGDLEFSFDVRPWLLQRAEQIDEGRLAEFGTADAEQHLAVWQAHGYATADAFLDAERDALRGWDATYRELARSDVTLGDTPARWTLGKRDAGCIKTLALPAGDDQWFVLRFLSVGAPADARPLREAVFASVRRRVLEPAIVLPPIGAAPRHEVAATSLARFLASARALGSVDEWWLAGAQRVDEGWLIAGARSVVVLGPDGARRLFARADPLRFALRSRGQLLVGLDGDAVHPVQDGQAGEVVFRAQRAVAAGDDVLLVREGARALPGLTRVGAVHVVRREPTGAERALATLHGVHVASLAANAANDRAALAVMRIDEDDAAPELRELDLRTGATRALGRWLRIAHVAAAPDGWLVTGQPHDRPTGVWRLRDPDTLEPLLTGAEVFGLAIADERLVVADCAGNRIALGDVPLADCRERGRTCQPFTGSHLARIGERALAGAQPPRTTAELAALRQRLDEVAQELAGATLPTTRADLDALVASQMHQDSPLDVPGRIVLGVLTATTIVAAGAQWVDGRAAGGADWAEWHVRLSSPADGPFAVVLHPGTLVAAALDDPEGALATALALDDAEGRPVLLGVDRPALAARAASLASPALAPALRAGDVAPLREVLAANAANVRLRRHVYAALAAHEHFAAVVALAGAWAEREPFAGVDLAARAAARSALATDAATARAWFEETARAVERAPREASLYLWLGTAAARAFPDEPRKARTCFARVLDLESWGEAATAARAAIDRLPR